MMKARGFIFTCKSEDQTLKHLVVTTNKVYANKVFAVREGDVVFLYNRDTDELYGVFKACSQGEYDPKVKLFYLKIQPIGRLKVLENANKVLAKLKISQKDVLNENGVKLLTSLLEGKTFSMKKDLIDRTYRPPLFSTTLWDFPKQSYGDTPKGNNKYPGVTPAFVIYNLIYRYTEPGDLVCDPMAGSGTTIDVCKEERRKVIAFDIVPTRKDIIQADARNLPLKSETVDMIFVDSPYGDNIKYNDHPLNIGHIPAHEERFYDELEKVIEECYRVLKPGKILAWLIGDQWVKGVFIPVAFKLYERLTKHFEPIDIICIVRRNQSSHTPLWHIRALQHGFYLRGFKYLLIARKSAKPLTKTLKISWNTYKR